MTRPELAVLLAFSKQSLTNAILDSSLPDSAYLDRDLRDYFPPEVVERFGSLLNEHPLRRELIAMLVSNDVVNSQGITFVSRLVTETGADAADVTRAYRIARDVTSAVERWDAIESLVGSVEPALMDELMIDAATLGRRHHLAVAVGHRGRDPHALGLDQRARERRDEPARPAARHQRSHLVALEGERPAIGCDDERLRHAVMREISRNVSSISRRHRNRSRTR